MQEAASSLPDQLDEAANYIKSLKENLKRMKEKRDGLMGLIKSQEKGSKSPRIQIQEMGSSSLVIALNAAGFNSQFIFNETIRILHDERAEIVNASFSVVDDDTILHTIHLTIGEGSPDYGAARISDRLKKFVHDVGGYNNLN
ncbi:Eukaryotic translation initiation factor 3 subunit 7 family protein [Hibiscus syriacus]|uniref:Eukaryotic translation initiation factor 3 subunit 7 family protein n=1 Tax=Hibiscus syriacus TaxID=106335 RepID=A0A6A2ZD71_HIBSY|nr:Eukaryotic translation initiation factor 3 subunit 7 family protein [Hibiscus syriacus]